MTAHLSATSPPLLHDEDVLTRATDLVERAHRRQLWLFLIDDDGRQQPTLPLFDLPRRSDSVAARRLPDTLCVLMSEFGAAELAIVYERPGRAQLSDADRSWFRLLVRGCELHEIALRGPLLAHGRGVRWIAPDDLR